MSANPIILINTSTIKAALKDYAFTILKMTKKRGIAERKPHGLIEKKKIMNLLKRNQPT